MTLHRRLRYTPDGMHAGGGEAELSVLEWGAISQISESPSKVVTLSLTTCIQCRRRHYCCCCCCRSFIATVAVGGKYAKLLPLHPPLVATHWLALAGSQPEHGNDGVGWLRSAHTRRIHILNSTESCLLIRFIRRKRYYHIALELEPQQRADHSAQAAANRNQSASTLTAKFLPQEIQSTLAFYLVCIFSCNAGLWVLSILVWTMSQKLICGERFFLSIK